MLIVLTRGPVATPLETSLNEELEAEIVVVYLVGEVPVAIAIGLCRGGLDKQCAILAHLRVEF